MRELGEPARWQGTGEDCWRLASLAGGRERAGGRGERGGAVQLEGLTRDKYVVVLKGMQTIHVCFV